MINVVSTYTEEYRYNMWLLQDLLRTSLEDMGTTPQTRSTLGQLDNTVS
jgi:hypothetical protein